VANIIKSLLYSGYKKYCEKPIAAQITVHNFLLLFKNFMPARNIKGSLKFLFLNCLTVPEHLKIYTGLILHVMKVVNHIFPFLLMLCCNGILQAQHDPSVLPSLINSETKTAGNADAVESLLKKQMFVKVFTNKQEVFVGEPLMATYKFYADISLNDRPSVTKQPEFAGCSVKE